MIIMGNRKNKLLILGAGGHGKVIADCATCMGCYEEIAFLDDVAPQKNFSYQYLGSMDQYKNYIDQYDMIVAVGNSKIREKFLEELDTAKGSIPIIIHPKAIVSRSAIIGAGTVVMPGAVINADVKIGKGAIVNTSCSIDHDSVIGDYAHIAVGAHLSGGVCIGKHTWIGAGAVVIQCISVCDNVMLGAGAVVINNIEESSTYVGVPATRI